MCRGLDADATAAKSRTTSGSLPEEAACAGCQPYGHGRRSVGARCEEVSRSLVAVKHVRPHRRFHLLPNSSFPTARRLFRNMARVSSVHCLYSRLHHVCRHSTPNRHHRHLRLPTLLRQRLRTRPLTERQSRETHRERTRQTTRDLTPARPTFNNPLRCSYAHFPPSIISTILSLRSY